MSKIFWHILMWGVPFVLTGCCGLFEERVMEEKAYTEFGPREGAKPTISGKEAEELCYNEAWQKCADAWQAACAQYPDAVLAKATLSTDSPCKDGKYSLGHIILLLSGTPAPAELAVCREPAFAEARTACLADKGYEYKVTYKQEGVCRFHWRLF